MFFIAMFCAVSDFSNLKLKNKHYNQKTSQKSWLEEDNIIISVIKKQRTVLAVPNKYPVPESQHRIKVSIIFTEHLNLCP